MSKLKKRDLERKGKKKQESIENKMMSENIEEKPKDKLELDKISDDDLI